MANTLVVPDRAKTPKERILLGDITILLNTCDGEPVEVHGLLANDLTVKTLQGELIPLTTYIKNYAGDAPDLENAYVLDSNGNVVTVKEIVDSVNNVRFTVDQLQEKYNNL